MLPGILVKGDSAPELDNWRVTRCVVIPVATALVVPTTPHLGALTLNTKRKSPRPSDGTGGNGREQLTRSGRGRMRSGRHGAL